MTVPLVTIPAGTSPRFDPTQVGGKAANLGRLREIVVAVPCFYVVTIEAFRHAMSADRLGERIERRLAAVSPQRDGDFAAASEDIRAWICGADPPAAMREAVAKTHLELLSENASMAVRSSAADEDTAERSFAGIYDSFLFVRGVDGVLCAIQRVWASAYSQRALAYRVAQGLSFNRIGVAVVVQEMIDASRSGVVFTCHPTTGNPHQIVVSSVFGAGEGLVSGRLPADTYTVQKDSLDVFAEIVEKQQQFVQGAAGASSDAAPAPLRSGIRKNSDERADGICRNSCEFPYQDRNSCEFRYQDSKQSVQGAAGASGLVAEAVPAADRKRSSLTDDEVRAVSQVAIEIERHFGRPQDIEFCFDRSGRLHLLQARPVSPVEDYGPAAGRRIVWDNSNIIESYAGVTSPMTFSFIRRAYTIVYHCFAEVMGIRRRVVQANRHTFENMLGLFRGRVYYNLANWYRLVRLFPGFAYNARFMETMMGLKESFALEDESPRPGRFRRWFVELPALLLLVARTAWNFLRIRSHVARFETNFRRHYSRWSQLDFRRMRPRELMDLYYEMEDALLWNWKAPIINDFYVMIFFGVLKRLCGGWCKDESGSLQNDLICGEGGLESAEPARMLLRLASLAWNRPELRELIETAPLESLPERIAEDSQFADFQDMMDRYLQQYGFRCMNELKLEEYSLRDRPAQVYQVLRNYLTLGDPAVLNVALIEAREQEIRRAAEQSAFASLRKGRGLMPRSAIFRWVLACARLGVKNRENMRFARTRIYGLLRELLRATGEHFGAEGILADREDIFYLRLDEVWDYIKGTAESTDLRGLAAVRRKEYDGYRSEQAAPADRFETYGMAHHRNSLHDWRRERGEETVGEGELRGTGCSPGKVTAQAQIVRSPDDDLNLANKILVAERTDPGWVPLYPVVAGILIERGSLLSHSAVVAREMGIPTIVGITGLLGTVQTGQLVKMDGRAGTVEMVDVELPEDQGTGDASHA